MSVTIPLTTSRVDRRVAWVPRQHGAWAMLLVPVCLGVAASRPAPWQLIVALAALLAYLASAALQAWLRARRPAAGARPVRVYAVLLAATGLVLVAAFPALVVVAVPAAAAAVIVIRGARPGTRRDLANSLAQVVQAVALVPAVALVSGVVEPSRVAAYSLVAAAYLLGTVLVVRSVLRERGNPAFAGLSVAAHVAFVGAAAVALPWPYAVVAAGLAARAGALPVAQRGWAGGGHPLRPIHVGIVEIVSSIAVVAVAFASRI